MRATWPLTGRAEELQNIAKALADPAIAGTVIIGGAGVGKSRIAREAMAAAASRGAETRWAGATVTAQALPLGALASYVDPNLTDTLALVRSAIATLTAARPGVLAVVAIDDVHALDALSAFVLQQIIARRTAKVMLTIRAGEPVPVEVQEILKHEGLHRIDLQPISRDETTQLLEATLGGPISADAARRLWNLTRGNVLYLRNIVEREVADGRLAPLREFWTWSGEPVVPTNLVEMIEARTEALPVAVGEVIDALAVGEPIELGSLTRITDAAAVEEADRHGLIKLDEVDGRVEVRVAHPLYAEVRRKRSPVTRLRRLRGRVATELAGSDGGNDMRTVVRRAALSLDSDLEPDPDLLVRAAHGAVWLADLPLADRLAHAAARAGAGPEAYIIRGCNLSGLSRGEEAEAVFADVPTSSFTEADHARLAFVRGMNLMYTLANPTRAKELVDDVSVTTSKEAQACIDAFSTVYWAAMGRPEPALTASRSSTLDELPAVVGAKTASKVAIALGDSGRTTEAVAAAEAGYAIVNGNFDAENLRFVVADGHVGALLQSGRVQDAVHAADQLRDRIAELPGVVKLLGDAVAGRAALGAGFLDQACALLEPIEMFAAESNGWGYRFLLPRIIALAIRGSPDLAATALATAEQYRHPGYRCFDYELGLAQAWVSAQQGVVSEAIAVLRSGAETAAGSGQFAAEVMCLQAAVQFGDVTAGPRLDDLAQMVEGPRVELSARFADTLRRGAAAELADLSHDFERMGDRIGAIDAAAHAATVFRREDMRGSANSCGARADALARQCGGASTPALRRVTGRLPLTDREREIAMLIGDGLSNRAVAQRLRLSTRTVEGHIYRAMAKTGAASRDELAMLLTARES